MECSRKGAKRPQTKHLTEVPMNCVLRLLRFDGHRLRETTESQSPMNEPVTASKKSRQKFDPAFKQQAVALWLTSHKAGSVVAAELGIKPNRLYSWRER